jgi:hypothetical protein
MSVRSGSFKLLGVAAGAVLMLAAFPAQARETATGDLARDLDNPRLQKAMGDMFGSMMGAMLDLKADPLARAMERMGEHDAARRIPKGATLGDLAGPEARQVPAEMRRRVPMMMGAMSELAGMMEQMAPIMAEIGKDFERQMDEAAKRD